MDFEEWADKAIREPLKNHPSAGTEYVESHKRALLVIAKSAWDTAENTKRLKGVEVSVDVSTCEEDGSNRVFARLTGENNDGTLLAELVSRNY